MKYLCLFMVLSSFSAFAQPGADCVKESYIEFPGNTEEDAAARKTYIEQCEKKMAAKNSNLDISGCKFSDDFQSITCADDSVYVKSSKTVTETLRKVKPKKWTGGPQGNTLPEVKKQ